jgi:L-threonylcarbamoyladenylate synthase
MPSHPVALALISQSGCSIAAPSANTSGRPSPTNARHVIEDLYGKVEIIIDCGASEVGLESTVLDLTVSPPVILRPGGVTPEQLKEALGEIYIDPALNPGLVQDLKPKAPGMKYTHYSPKAEMVIYEGSLNKVVENIGEKALELTRKGKKVGILATDQTLSAYKCGIIISVGDRAMPETIASRLFGALRAFDEQQAEVILAEAVDDAEIGMAVMNRMRKAAGYNIVKV